MKIDITFDHTDVLNFIEQLLMVKGMKPVGPVRFTRARAKKGDATTFSVKVECEGLTEAVEDCPLCELPLQREESKPQAALTPNVGVAADTQGNTSPRNYAADIPVETVKLDASLGEMRAPPPEIQSEAPTSLQEDIEDADTAGMASFAAQNRALIEQKERENG